jgi:putative ABC transport system permease protein
MYGIEDSMFELKKEWKLVGTKFSKNDAPEAYLGINAYKRLGLKLGETIDVNIKLGEEKKQFNLKLVGYLEQTGTSDDNFIFMPIDFVTTIVPPGHTIKGVAIRVKAGSSIAKVAEELAKIPDVQTVTYKQVQYTLNDLLNTTTQLLNLAMLFTLLIGIVGLLNTIFMSIEDRKKELGMLKAIGASNKDIIRIIMTETAMLVSLGALFGVLLSLLMSRTLELFVRKLITSAPPGQLASYTPTILIGTIFISILVGTVASIFPCIKATKISPMEVIRNE